MKQVAKYNVCKGVSALLTVGTPIITLACCGDLFVHRADTAISAAGAFAILIALLFLKDKIAEKFKSPPALAVAVAVFVLCLVVEHVILPVKIVCAVTMVTCGVDELTFKSWYKRLEKHMPEIADDYKHFGFIFTTTKKLIEEGSTSG